MGRDRGTRAGVAVDGSVHQVNRVRAVDGEGSESRSTDANNKLCEFIGKQPLSDQRDSGGSRKSNVFLTQNILIHTIVQGRSGPGGPSGTMNHLPPRHHPEPTGSRRKQPCEAHIRAVRQRRQ